MILNSQTYNQLALITAPKIHTDLLWDLSFLFIGLASLYFIFIFYFRNRISKNLERVKQSKREFSPMISEFLFHEEEASKDEKSNYVHLKIEIRELLKDDFNRKVISEVLLDLRKDVSGDTQKRLFKLYQDLGLHTDDFGRLKSWRWQIVSKAILNLTQMQVAEAYSFTTKFINDKRDTIRKQAEIAIVTLKPEGVNYFLDTTKFKISEWQQLKLMDVLRMDDDYQPPRFKAWLTSTNRHVVLFALRLIKFYNQNDADASLIELVKHKNNQIKEAAISCIKEFYIVEAIPTIKLVFWKSSTDVKISILNAIGALGSESDIEFLRLIEKKERNFSVRSKAHSSINEIAPNSIMPSKGVVNTAKYTIPSDIKIEVTEEEIDTEGFVQIANSNSIEDIEIDTETESEEEITIEQYLPTTISEESVDKPEEIIDDEAKINITKENQESKESETLRSNSGIIHSEENDDLSFDFLPFVVEEFIAVKPTDLDQTDYRIELNELVINFEEVFPNQEVISLKKKTSSLEIREEELAFLPLVTDAKEESDIENLNEEQSNTIVAIEEIEAQFEGVQLASSANEPKLPLDYSEYKTLEIFDTPVVYDEIDVPVIAVFKSENNSQSDPYALPLQNEIPLEDTMDLKSNANQQTSKSYDLEPEGEQKFKKILKTLIDFKEQKQSKETKTELEDAPLLDFVDEFSDTNKISETDKEIESKIDNDLAQELEEKVQDKPEIFKVTIPEAILTDDIYDEIIIHKENTEESRMQLLDDIAAMGDQREVPLLIELLVNEKYQAVTDRVKALIEKFSETEEKREPAIFLKPFNVFEDLFRTCDTEAKLILMDEIVAVGDEGEIGFLEGLLEDADNEISHKAAHIIEALKVKILANDKTKNHSKNIDTNLVKKIEVVLEEKTLINYDSLLEELQIAPPKTSEIFDLTFELTEPLDKIVDEESIDVDTKRHDSIFGQICCFSSKIIDKLNG